MVFHDAVALRGDAATKLGPRHASMAGFDLHAGIVVAVQHERRRRLCRYTVRPPWGQTGRPTCGWRSPAMLEHLAIPVPRPFINLTDLVLRRAGVAEGMAERRDHLGGSGD